jgi:hypothetical protein
MWTGVFGLERSSGQGEELVDDCCSSISWRGGSTNAVVDLDREREQDFVEAHFLGDLRLLLVPLPRGKNSSVDLFLELGGLLRYLVVDLTPSLAASSERTQMNPFPGSSGGRSSFRKA